MPLFIRGGRVGGGVATLQWPIMRWVIALLVIFSLWIYAIYLCKWAVLRDDS